MLKKSEDVLKYFLNAVILYMIATALRIFLPKLSKKACKEEERKKKL
jgi:hypothetical protein